MKQRIYTGEYGRMTGAKKYPMGFASPETVKIYLEILRAVPPEGVLDGYSRDMRYWSFGGVLYQLEYRELIGWRFKLLDDGVRTFLGRGAHWLLQDKKLSIPNGVFSTEFPFLIPNLQVLGVDPWEPSWKEMGGVGDAPLAQNIDCSSGVFFESWGWSGVPLSFYQPNRIYYELLSYIHRLQLTKHPLVPIFLERLSSISMGSSRDMTNPTHLYSSLFYDTFLEEEKTKYRIAEQGGFWREGSCFYSFGDYTGGTAFAVPTVFSEDGICWGLSFINSAVVRSPVPSYFLPKPGGVSVVGRREGESLGSLIPCEWPRIEYHWERALLEQFTEGQLGTTEGEQFISRQWGFMGISPSWWMGPDLIRAWIPPVEGRPEKIYGGRAATIEGWVASESGSIQDAIGPLLVSEEVRNTQLTDIRTLRRHILPGRLAEVVNRQEEVWASSVRVTEDSVVGEDTPLKGMAIQPFSQEIRPENLITPWQAFMGSRLEIGWWDFPQIGLTGSPPNLAWLNKDWGGSIYQYGGGDHLWGDLAWTRSSLSITSDGIVYGTADISRAKSSKNGNICVFAFQSDGEDWKTGRADFSVSDTRVSPLGQGCYYVYHYPGEDWSIFHAPVGEVNYRQIWEATDWSFLSALTGLAGGFALQAQLDVQAAFDKYMEASYGNLMLIYTNPRQFMAIGDVLFENPSIILQEEPAFWTFTGWAHLDGGPSAIFSRMISGSPTVWAVGKWGKREIRPEEAGAVGEKAKGLIPSAFYPQLAQRPTGDAQVIPSGSELFFDEGSFYYPLPDFPDAEDAQAGKDFLEQLALWTNKARHVNASSVVVGQSTNHQILDSAAIDPSIPFIDARLQRREDSIWVMLQHESGVWISVNCNVTADEYLFEEETGWQLVSLGLNYNKSLVAIFSDGKIDQGTFRTEDLQMAYFFGQGRLWEWQAIYKWPARLYPVVITQNTVELEKLLTTFNK